MERRVFLKLMGSAMSGIFLTACSGGGGAGGGGGPSVGTLPIPPAYRFTTLLRTGDALPDGPAGLALKVADFPLSALLNDRGETFFHAIDSRGAMGVYRLPLDPSDERPRTAGPVTRLVRNGDTVPGGETVAQVELGATNAQGGFAFRAVMQDGDPEVYLARPGAEIAPVLTVGAAVPEVGGIFSNTLGDLELLDNGAVLVAAGFAGDTARGLLGRQGLFYLPQGELGSQSQLLVATGDVIPGTEETVGGLGLLDGDGASPYYVNQIFPAGAELSPGDVPQGGPPPLLVGAPVSPQPVAPRVLVAPEEVPMPDSVRARTSVGSSTMGARVAPDGTVAAVVQESGGERLTVGGLTLLRTGQASPLGARLTSFSGPVVGPPGLTFVQVFTEGEGSELMVTDGRRMASIFTRGFHLDGRAVARFAFGLVRDQADTRGRLLFPVEFEDGSQALVLGVPV